MVQLSHPYMTTGKTMLFSHCVQLFVTPWNAARQAFLSITISLSFLKLVSIESVMPSNEFISCHSLLLPSIFPRIRVFSVSQLFASGGQSVEASASVQFSSSVVSNSLRPHGLQHARSPCPSSTPGVYPNSCPLSQWCYPTISSSVIPFSSCLQFFPASGSFPMSQVFASGGQSIRVSASASVLPVNTQDWSLLGWLVGSPCSLRDSRVFSNTTVQKHQFFGAQLSL